MLLRSTTIAALLVASVRLLPAERFIVELTADPVAETVARQPRREGLRSAAAVAQRNAVRLQQAQVRSRLDAEITVLDAVETVANALIVETPAANRTRLASMSGVHAVYAVRRFRMVLDRAAVVNRVAEAWNQAGFDQAGAGVKIAVIDSGIDATHPGFSDPSLPMPAAFPVTDGAGNLPFTNNKVIVARSYVTLLSYRDPDLSARDRVGHGTAIAMVAAGVRNTGPLATIAGMAPKAWLGNYKIFGTPGYNDDVTDAAIVKAIDDAVADGMDIISLSVGSSFAPRLADDIDVKTIERAAKAGVIVVAAAGNEGPNGFTISSPSTAPSAIAVGASNNDRTFSTTIQVAGVGTFASLPGDGPAPAAPINSTLVDVAVLDSTGLACSSLPANALKGRIVLILRGTCYFEDKLLNVQKAGAAGAVIYSAESSPSPTWMVVGTATIPAQMVSYWDGLAIKAGMGEAPTSATMKFTLDLMTTDAGRMTDFSSIGPNVDAGIKPDLVAVGASVYTATQSYDSNGDMFSSDRYIQVDGTSFSTPLVAGVAALLKGARPGLTVDQYRSLIINSSREIRSYTGEATDVQQSGAGLLDAVAALRSTTAVFPSSLSFGAGSGQIEGGRTLTVTNLGTASDIYTVAVTALDGDAAPTLSAASLQLAGGASGTVTLSWQGTGLRPGAHEGFVRLVSAASGAETRVPYWYGVTSSDPVTLTIMDAYETARRGSYRRDAVSFRVTDSAGMPITLITPGVTVTEGGGSAQLVSHDADYPGVYGIDFRLGPNAGNNTVRIQAGTLSVDVSIVGQ